MFEKITNSFFFFFFFFNTLIIYYLPCRIINTNKNTIYINIYRIIIVSILKGYTKAFFTYLVYSYVSIALGFFLVNFYYFFF